MQDLFEDGSEEITVINNAQQRNQIIPKTFKEGYISHMLRKSSSKRPTWFIGSEEEFLKSCELKKNLFHDDNKKTSPDTTKNCSKITVSSQVAILPVVAGRTSVTEKTPTEKRPPITIGKHKKVIEPSITPVCTPTSDCDDCFKSNQLLLTPSVERLLPIGASRGTGKNLVKQFLKKSGKTFYKGFSSHSPESPLSKMDLMITGKFYCVTTHNSMFSCKIYVQYFLMLLLFTVYKKMFNK